MKMNDEKIENLWKWFLNNEHQIKQCIETESASEQDYIIEQLDNLILDLGMFTWEIGAGTNKTWYLTISPNGDKTLLKKSRKIMESAPGLIDWEFNYCKPVKDWNRIFTIYDGNMIEQKIDASNWKYVALQNENGKIELTLEAKNISHLDSDTAKTSANLVVLNEIGEENKIYHINSVSIVDELDKKHDSLKADIDHFKKHLIEIKTLPETK